MSTELSFYALAASVDEPEYCGDCDGEINGVGECDRCDGEEGDDE